MFDQYNYSSKAMYGGRNFFNSKNKKSKKPTRPYNHSRSLSAKSEITKNSGRGKPQPNIPPLTKKQKQIREAIQYRYRKSKLREYVYEQGYRKSTRRIERSHSSQMPEYKNLKQLKYVNLKEHHEQQQKRKAVQLHQEEQFKRSIKNRLKIRTDNSLIMKTQGSQRSMEKFKFLKPYMQGSRTPTKKDDWKFISIQMKGKNGNRTTDNKSQKEIKIKSHRTLTLQQKSRTKMKASNENKQTYSFVPKFNDLNKMHHKYKF